VAAARGDAQFAEAVGLNAFADVVSQHGIDLRRSGSSLVGRCPFHADSGRPNPAVPTHRPIHVFPVSGARGDVIGFIQQIEHLTFREAVQRLGETGPEHHQAETYWQPRPVHSQQRQPLQRPEDLEVLSAAMELYRNRLLVDGEALHYLMGRGLQPDTIEQAQLGLAVCHVLVRYLASRRLPIESARRCGLIRASKKERLAGRLVIPEIRDGYPVWMAGRLLNPSPDEPKYLGLYGAPSTADSCAGAGGCGLRRIHVV
jgi:DNA primase